MIDKTRVLGRIKIFNTKQALDFFDSLVCESDGFMFFIKYIVCGVEFSDDFCKLIIGIWIIACRSRNNERGASLVNENGINLIDNGKV